MTFSGEEPVPTAQPQEPLPVEQTVTNGSEPPEETPPGPANLDEWRTLLKGLPVADLLKLVQEDRARAGRLLQGFRPSGNSLRDAMVQKRMAEEALKQPVFAARLRALQAASAVAAAPPPPTNAAPPAPVPTAREVENLRKEIQTLREALDKKRDAARDRDIEIRELKAKLATVERERDTAVLNARKAREAQETAEAEVERLRHQLRREERREEKKPKGNPAPGELAAASRGNTVATPPQSDPRTSASAAPNDTAATPTEARRQVGKGETQIPASLPVGSAAVAATTPTRAEPVASAKAGFTGADKSVLSTTTLPPTLAVSVPPDPLREAVDRLLNRGRYATVVELCREALLTEAARNSAVARGELHSLLAVALQGQGETENAEAQDRQAVTTLLDGGAVLMAAEAFARLIQHTRTPRKADSDSLRRLLALAKRAVQEEEVAAVFQRVRLRSRDGYRRLTELGGSGLKALLGIGTAVGSVLGPDEAVILPNYGAPLTPRRIREAVEAGEEHLVQRVRQGIAQMRLRGAEDAQQAEALLDAIAGLGPATVEPLLRAQTEPVIVDASNVARYNPDPLALNKSPRVAPLLTVRDGLLRRGFFPVWLVADASLRHYVDDLSLYSQLVERHVIDEVAPGTSADDEIVRRALERGGLVISNDMFSDRDDTAQLNRLGFHIESDTFGLIRN